MYLWQGLSSASSRAELWCESVLSCRSIILSDDIRDEAETKAFRKKLKHFGLHEHFTAVYTFILRTSYTGSLQILFYKHNYYTCSFKNKFVLNLQTAIIFHMNFMHSLRQTCGWPNKIEVGLPQSSWLQNLGHNSATSLRDKTTKRESLRQGLIDV